MIKILESDQFQKSKMELPYAVGYDIMGEMVIADIAEFPHLLVGGTTNSGKSSALHSLLTSIVYKQPSNKVKLLLLDFGASSLKMFDKVPHMIHPTIRSSEAEKGRQSLLWLQREMEERLKRKDSLERRKFDAEFRKWPSIICVIDEFQKFIEQLTIERHNKKDYMIIEDILARARKVKIYLVLATQNAAKGNIEIRTTNLGARIAFKCETRYDSEAIIVSSDAVNLSSKGAMYFKCYQHDGLKRVQGSYMHEDEIADMLEKMEFNQGCSEGYYDEVKFVPSLSNKSDADVLNSDIHILEDTSDELLNQIVILALKKNKLSNNDLKKSFRMGYDRANPYLDQLVKEGIISELKEGTRLPRKVDVEKGKEFLISHGYVEIVDEGKWVRDENAFRIQTNEELAGEQNIASDIAVMDVQKHIDDSQLTLSPAEMIQAVKKIKSDLKVKK